MNIDDRRWLGEEFISKLAQALHVECPDLMPDLFERLAKAIGVDAKYRAKYFAECNRAANHSIQRENLVVTLRIICNTIEGRRKPSKKPR